MYKEKASFSHQFNKISALEDSHLKYLKFISLGFKLVPASSEQQKAIQEIHRLSDLGFNK